MKLLASDPFGHTERDSVIFHLMQYNKQMNTYWIFKEYSSVARNNSYSSIP